MAFKLLNSARFQVANYSGQLSISVRSPQLIVC
jgi:hypothetical protein